MQAQEIEHYLAELGAALQSHGISKPVRLLLIGGAYMMLLANAPPMILTYAGSKKAKTSTKLGWHCETLSKPLPGGIHSHPIGSIFSHKCSSMIKLSCRGANYGNDMGRCTCMPRPRS